MSDSVITQLSVTTQHSVTNTACLTQWHCYMLETCDGGRSKTYVGATINPNRRLRQHNGEISGGARATSGRRWRRRYLVGGFADERAALKFEWRWKYLTRYAPFDSWQEKRAQALATLLAEMGEGLEILEGDGISVVAEPQSTA
jgi:predicted GIY-YIG superfamily endonuclease